MKKVCGVVSVAALMFLSFSVFAKGLVFEVDGKKYEAAQNDLKDVTWDQANSECSKLKGWSLPSYDLVYGMYEQLYKKGIGGFSKVRYWSSNEALSVMHEIQNFSTGESVYSKGSKDYARCVKAL